LEYKWASEVEDSRSKSSAERIKKGRGKIVTERQTRSAEKLPYREKGNEKKHSIGSNWVLMKNQPMIEKAIRTRGGRGESSPWVKNEKSLHIS